MPYRITITEEAESHLRDLTARERRMVAAGLVTRLQHQPTATTRAIRKLRPNPLAEFELRIGPFRVLYDVEGDDAVLLLVGRRSATPWS